MSPHGRSTVELKCLGLPHEIKRAIFDPGLNGLAILYVGHYCRRLFEQHADLGYKNNSFPSISRTDSKK